MSLRNTARALGGAGLLFSATSGFSDGDCVLTRSVNRTAALTNTPIVVTAIFTNAGAFALRGFCYSEQVPSGLALSPLGVMLNGRVVTNYTFEPGQNGDIYAGYTPYRWVLERPVDFTEVNPVSSHADVQILYAIGSLVSGTFDLSEFSWAGYYPGSTNAIFGYSGSSDQQPVWFLTTDTPPVVTGEFSNNGFTIGLTGVPDVYYEIEASTNLFDWISIITNSSPFHVTETNPASVTRKVYRGRRR